MHAYIDTICTFGCLKVKNYLDRAIIQNNDIVIDPSCNHVNRATVLKIEDATGRVRERHVVEKCSNSRFCLRKIV